jgi:hypothetical protein
VATSDGLVDVWGPRINWTAFAPDFQALPRNVEYVEREDEFDQVVVADKIKSSNDDKSENNEMNVEREVDGEKNTSAADPNAAASSTNNGTTTTPMDVDDATTSRDENANADLVATDAINNNNHNSTANHQHNHHTEEDANEDTIVDVQTIKPVPVFASDSEDETQVFSFETRLKNIILMRMGKGMRQVNKEDD